MVPHANGQKFFGSFFQKRTSSSLTFLSPLIFDQTIKKGYQSIHSGNGDRAADRRSDLELMAVMDTHLDIRPAMDAGGAGLIALPEISDARLQQLVHDMDHAGYGVIENYVPAADLARMRAFVADAIAAAGQRYVGFVGKAAVAGSVLAEVSELPAFRALMRRVYERGTGRPAPQADLYQVLRCLAGESGQAHSLIFHYDSYVVTALIPVEIPTGDLTGDLIIVKPRRAIRATYLANLIDKILLDNKVTQLLLRGLHRIGLLPIRRVKMVPGNIYFFWGYRSVHANEACDPKHVRATAIYHFANPHAQSQFGAKVRALLPR